MRYSIIILNGNAQWRDDHLKLERLDLLEVNSYNPIQPFKTPLTWGFNLGWRQEAVHDGVYSDEKQHGVASFNAQVGYSLADYERKHICYGQVQTYVQAGSNLDKGWRVGVGPTLGCMNQWLEKFNTVVQVELPYWEDQNQWNLRLNTQWQYAINSNNAIRFNWDYEKQNHLDWMKSSLGYVWFF